MSITFLINTYLKPNYIILYYLSITIKIIFMKKLLVLICLSLIAFAIPKTTYAQDNPLNKVTQADSTITSVDPVNTPVTTGDSMAIYMTIFAILGLIARSAYLTYLAIKNKENGTPNNFDIWYWLYDNFLQKIATLVTAILAATAPFNLQGGLLKTVLLCIAAFIAGYLLDKFYGKLLSPGEVKK